MADAPFAPEPKAEITLTGRTVSRGHISNDWGTRVHWKILRDGVEIDAPEARVQTSYELPTTLPGAYEVVLETWKHEGYQSKGLGKYIEISNRVSYRV